MKKKIKVIHVHFKDATAGMKKDFYFGSKAALCRAFGKDMIGISLTTLKGYDIATEQYENKKCIINQGELLTSGDI